MWRKTEFSNDEKNLKEACVVIDAINQKKIGLCDVFEEQDTIDGCYSFFAIKTAQSESCNKIHNETRRVICSAGAEKDSSLCESLKGDDQMLCMATTTLDRSLCSGVQEYEDCIWSVDDREILLTEKMEGTLARLK